MPDDLLYYVGPGGETAYTTPHQPPPKLGGTPMTRATKAEYDAKLAANAAASLSGMPLAKLREPMSLKVDRSPGRVAPAELDGNYLDEGRQYAVYVPDGPWESVNYRLDGVAEAGPTSAPWDAFGTAPDGGAVWREFSAGSHVLEADVTAGGETRTLTANFEVE